MKNPSPLLLILLGIFVSNSQASLQITIDGELTPAQIALLQSIISDNTNGSVTLEDINECDQIDICPSGSTCFNIEGSYNCTCNGGFTVEGSGDNGHTLCEDIDECTEDATLCSSISGSTCENSPGTFDCVCDSGFEVNADGNACVDINECNLDGCSGIASSTCHNSEGSFECVCATGFAINVELTACEDINECLQDETLCSERANSVCVNTEGGHLCECSDGFEESAGDCININECTADVDPCAEVTGSACVDLEGSYECACESGNQVNADGTACEDINECDSTFDILHDCSANEVCVNTDGGYDCVCAPGYESNGGVCTDINECDGDPCDVNAFCLNIEGSFNCFCNSGYFGNGTVCADVLACSSFELLQMSIMEIQNADPGDDVSSYQETLNDFNSASGLAEKVPGDLYRAFYGTDLDSFIANVIDDLRCDFFSSCSENDTSEAIVYTCTCNKGYEYVNGSVTQCQDVDECDPNSCGDMATCSNNIGSFTCTCPAGYEIVGDDITVACTDINECTEETHDCDVNGICSNQPGTFQCTCQDGYMGDGRTCESAVSCEAFNEVRSAIDTVRTGGVGDDTSAAQTTLQYYIDASGKADGISGDSYRAFYGSDLDTLVSSAIDLLRCDYFSTCTESLGIDNETLYSCSCFDGYKSTLADINQCEDIDECSPTDGCAGTGTCENLQGSYQCDCFAGFTEQGESLPCLDIDECVLGTHMCDATGTCVNKDGGYDCSCNSGYEGGEGGPCTNIDECSVNSHNCDSYATCSDIIGSFTCQCNAGYTGDGVTCQDIDECVTGDHTCDASNGVCSNGVGGFSCACAYGYMGTGYGEGSCEDVRTCETFNKVKSAIINVKDNTTSDEDIQVLQFYAAAMGRASGVSGDAYRARYDPDNMGLVDVISDVIDELRCDFFSTCSLNDGSGESSAALTAFVDSDSTSGSGSGSGSEDSATVFTEGSGSGMSMYTCTCIAGYEGVSDYSNQCTDVDECAGENSCHPERATCYNTEGSYECACNEGFEGNGRYCDDVDECDTENPGHTCDENADCSNTNGSFECSCQTQYMGTGQNGECTSVLTCDAFDDLKNAIRTIQDPDSSEESMAEARQLLHEYDEATGKADGVTQNAFRARYDTVDDDVEMILDSLRCDFFSMCSLDGDAYSCSCMYGYEEDAENGGCKDVDECDLETDNCHSDATCTNTEGSFECNCDDGFFGNGTTCSDHDECDGEGGGHDCDENATCENIEGGHTCTCDSEFFGNGSTCNEVNTCEAFNSVKAAIAVLHDEDADEEDIASARNVLREYYAATGKTGSTSGDSYRFEYGDMLDDDIANVIDSLICDYHSTCDEGDAGPTCTCFTDHIPAYGNTCSSVRSCATFGMVKDAITTVRESTDEADSAVQAAREVLEAFHSATGHADSVEGASYRARFGDVTDTDVSQALDLLPCDYFSECSGDLECSCIGGYQPVESSNACTDVDECETDMNSCDTYASCFNNEGSYDCTCNDGFNGNGTHCEDVEQCSGPDSLLCGANAECSDTVGSFSCECNDGYSGDGQVCIEDVECLFAEDSDESIECTNAYHPLSCEFRKTLSTSAESTFDSYRAFFNPPNSLESSAAETRNETDFTFDLAGSSGTSLCPQTNSFTSPSMAYVDAAETEEMELFSYDCHRQWYAVTECSGTTGDINGQCNTIKTPRNVLVISKDSTTGKFEVRSEYVYLPSSCQFQFGMV